MKSLSYTLNTRRYQNYSQVLGLNSTQGNVKAAEGPLYLMEAIVLIRKSNQITAEALPWRHHGAVGIIVTNRQQSR